MRKSRKLPALFLAAVMVLAFTACAEKINTSPSNTPAYESGPTITPLPGDTGLAAAGKYAVSAGGTYISDNGYETVILHSSGSMFTVDGRLNKYQESIDGTKAAFTADDTLYYTDGGKPQKVAEDVYSFDLALSGNAIIYMTQMQDDKGALSIFSGGMSVTISTNVYPNYECISPDGKSAIFVRDDENDGSYNAYLWNNKESSELGSGLLPVMIADGAKYVYYFKDSALYVREGNNADTETKLGDSINAVTFSSDCSQIVYHSNGDAYISKNGGKGQVLSGNIEAFIVPGGTQTAMRYDSLRQPIFVYGVAGFADTFYSDDDLIYRINGEFEALKIAESASGAELTSDGKTLVYFHNDTLCKMDGLMAGAQATEWVDKDAEIVEMVAVLDGDRCYFINLNSELCYQQGTGSARVISDINAFNNSYAVLYQQNRVFFISGEALYVSDSGEKPVQVTGVKGNVTTVGRLGMMIVVETDEGRYVSQDGDTFHRV